jgi:hypothetical protein
VGKAVRDSIAKKNASQRNRSRQNATDRNKVMEAQHSATFRVHFATIPQQIKKADHRGMANNAPKNR